MSTAPPGEPPVCPECRALKCRNCDGTAWDPVADEPVVCACSAAGHPPPGPLRAV